MKWSIILLLLASPVISDMCQDLCVRDLGRFGCPKGSWCKNGNDCQSLFWTTADRTNVCVYIGSSGTCLNRYPVLCHEATARLGGASGSAPAATTTTPARATTTTSTTVTTTHMIQSTRTTATASSIESTTTTTRSATRRNIQGGTAQGSGVLRSDNRRLSLHYNPFESDFRPRVKVSFLAHGQDIGFSLVFDTGSDKTHILMAGGPDDVASDAPPSYLPEDGIDSSLEPVNRPARWMEGYLDVGLVAQTSGAGRLVYGTDDNPRPIDVTRRINEVAQLYSGATTFVHEIEIDLTTKVDNRFTGIGLLGAGRTSHFARAAGVFAYMGPLVDYSGWATASAGTLHIVGRDGGEQLNDFCRTGSNIEYFPLAGNSIHWMVRGSIESGTMRHDLSFIVDTGASGVFVTTDILNAIKAALVASGAVLAAAVPGHLLRYDNCFRYRELPAVKYTVGSGPMAVSISLTPEDYIVGPSGPVGTCFLNLFDATAGTTSRLFGMELLSKLLTVFDETRNRIGFCHTRS